MCSTLILGIGNLLRKDDGVGIHVVERLRRLDLFKGSEDVRLLDGGTAGLSLLSYLESIEYLIIVDALLAPGQPGEVRTISEEQISQTDTFGPTHDGRLADVVKMARTLGNPMRITVIGVIPKDVHGFGAELSSEVDAAIPRVIDAVKERVAHSSSTLDKP